MPDDEEAKELADGGCSDPEKTSACRITKSTDTYQSACSTGHVQGVDGVECKSGEDCAPGFECIDGDRGGVCRRYCCTASSCTDHVSMNGGSTFCDIQKMVDYRDHSAPVCMPLKKCKLLNKGDCSAQETCGIVTEKGENGCVPIGNADVGQSCDEEHCKEGATCLGNAGDRKCFQLCRTDGSDCQGGQTCTTGAVFQNPAFGVCQNAR